MSLVYHSHEFHVMDLKVKLSSFRKYVNMVDLNQLRLNISSLNNQQRRLFDDFTERCISSDVDEQPVYLFLAGNAGTGKSFLVKLLIEAVKFMKIKPGDDLKKPPVLVMAPTANAAFIIGGKTIDSLLGFLPSDGYCYKAANSGKMSMMRFQFEDVCVIFCDEISMVGAGKLLKINFRLQELFNESRSQDYMGGISFVASGDLWQLPPIMDKMVTEKSHLDSRPECAPSHWKQYFRIFYLTEKMRSQKDPYFSDLCDRVGRGTVTESDEIYLASRVQSNPSEDSNEHFKSGKLLIIVTTNPKKDLINHKKLCDLLPNEVEYRCLSTDRVTNLPMESNIPDKLKENPGKTGNLESELRLRVGAPIVITKNHSKKKYREDGIVNGARGYVQAIQTAKDNPKKVDVIWVVFNNESIGQLYRFENNHLRKLFNPGHPRSTPILPIRTNFKIKFGNVDYQRENFPLSLAYAITAHKCQGETLEEVIIDFGGDKEHRLKNYICSGSFYVAITRVREGNKVFLKSFDKSYIQVNKVIQERVDAMIKYRSYDFKKIYLDQKIFHKNDSEIRLGYLNINGLIDGNHCHYFNCDKNLISLDIIVLAETKLDAKHTDQFIKEELSNWILKGRYDAEDQRKHMGLLLLISKKSKYQDQIQSLTIQTLKRDENLQIQGLIVRLLNDLKIGFIYCRSTPTHQEINAINKAFDECHILTGDFNLSHRIAGDKEKLTNLCQTRRKSVLNEITRSQSNNQLDYVLVDAILKQFCFATSFNNFISDHKSVTARIGLYGNQITDEVKAKLTFDREFHLKTKEGFISDSESASNASDTSDSYLESSIDQDLSLEQSNQESKNGEFKRRFSNLDLATCWLNSCLQLILIAIDHNQIIFDLSSELGNELKRLWRNNDGKILESITVKEILVSAEDLRIATRLSELRNDIDDQIQLAHQTRAVEMLRLNLISGQQCVRDFFICLKENIMSWPDVCTPFSFSITHSTRCCSCNHIQRSETIEMSVDVSVPENNSSLSDYVSEYLSTSELVGYFCEHGCKKNVEVEKRSIVTNISEVKFIIIILTRGVPTADGYRLIHNEVTATDNLSIR